MYCWITSWYLPRQYAHMDTIQGLPTWVPSNVHWNGTICNHAICIIEKPPSIREVTLLNPAFQENISKHLTCWSWSLNICWLHEGSIKPPTELEISPRRETAKCCRDNCQVLFQRQTNMCILTLDIPVGRILTPVFSTLTIKHNRIFATFPIRFSLVCRICGHYKHFDKLKNCLHHRNSDHFYQGKFC